MTIALKLARQRSFVLFLCWTAAALIAGIGRPTPALAQLSPPSMVTATPGNNQATLNWSSVPGATRYIVKRSTKSGGPYNLVAVVFGATSYIDTGVTNGTTYYYVIDAANDTFQSGDSAEVSVTPGPTLPTPTNLAASVSNGMVFLNWTGPPGAVSYNIKRSETDGGPYTVVATGVAGTAYTDSSVLNGHTYYYVVTAVFGSGAESGNSNQAQAVVPALTPPANLTAVSGNHEVDLSWSAVPEAASYTVERSTVSGGPYAVLATGVTATTYQDKTALNGRTYYYVVLSHNAAGDSPDSGQAIGMPSLPAPTNLMATAANAQVTLTWTAVAGATSYNVKRSTTSGGPYTNLATVTGTTSYVDTTALNTVTYYYVVTALDATSESPASNEASATPFAPPAAPTNLTATPGNNKVTLSWTGSATASGYNVKRASMSGGPYTVIASNVAGTTYTDTTVTNGVTYYYVVSAVNVGGESGLSNEVQATPVPPPPAPTNLSALPGNAKVTLSWNSIGVPASYNVKRSTTAGGPYTTVASSLTATTYVDTTVTNGTTYYYVVTAVTAAGESAPSNEASVTPQLPPPTPTGVTATAGNMQVVIQWTASAGAASYNVKRSTTSGGPYTILQSVTSGTTYTDTTVQNGTTYYYVVSAVGGGVESPDSNEASATPQPPPPAPTNVAAAAGDKQVTLTWTAAPGAASYTIYRGVNPGAESPTPIAVGVTVTNFTDTGLTDGTTYYYVVAAVNSSGRGGLSSEVSATPEPPPPGAPTALAAKAGDARVVLTWKGVQGATSYNVKRGPAAGGPFAVVATGVTSTTYTDTGLANSSTYFYVVSAVNGGGEGPNSTAVSATPVALPKAPTNLKAVGGDRQVTLSWTAAAGATSYDVKRGAATGGPYTLVASGITSTSYNDAGLTNGTTYTYVVAGVSASGEGPNSNEAIATAQVPPPPAPSSVTVTPGDKQATVTWMAAANADTYNVKRGTSANGPFTTVAGGLTGTTYTDTGLTDGTTYYYVVSSVNVGGEGPNSAAVSVTPAVPPPAPTSLTAAAVSGSEIDLTWVFSGSSATGFSVERMSAGQAFAVIATVGAAVRAYADTGVKANTTYTYRVRAINGSSFSNYSNLATATIGTDGISGTVSVSANGIDVPLPGVTVELLDATATSVLKSTTTDQTGRYSFANLVDGTYSVMPVPTSEPPVPPATVTVSASVDNGAATQDFKLTPLDVFQAGLSLVSVPFSYNGTSVTAASVLGVSLRADGSAPIAGFDPTINNYVIYPNLPDTGVQTEPGRGYWVKEQNAQPFVSAGNPVNAPVELTFAPGWNLIGDPYLTQVDLSSIQVRIGGNLVTLASAVNSGVVGNTIYGYSPAGNQYYAAPNLLPFQGYWIYISPQGSGGQPVGIRFNPPAR